MQPPKERREDGVTSKATLPAAGVNLWRRCRRWQLLTKQGSEVWSRGMVVEPRTVWLWED